MSNRITLHEQSPQTIACPCCAADLPFHDNARNGDVSLCIACGGVAIYTDRQTLKSAEVNDILSLSASEFSQVKTFWQNTRHVRANVKRIKNGG